MPPHLCPSLLGSSVAWVAVSLSAMCLQAQCSGRCPTIKAGEPGRLRWTVCQAGKRGEHSLPGTQQMHAYRCAFRCHHLDYLRCQAIGTSAGSTALRHLLLNHSSPVPGSMS